ncbi:MAG: hypothetical protein ACW99U_11470 [Candidatus Thorarchaeota archaeon]|jgi:hypothetical protein
MISKDRPQNFIVVLTIIAAVFSGFSLVSTATHYSGSYIIISHLEVDLVDVTVRNVDPTNTTINPSVSAAFNFKAPNVDAGSASLTFLTAQILLNGESFTYAYFRLSIPSEHRTVFPGYDRNFSVGSTISIMEDKQILYNASAIDTWTFTVVLTMFYHLFESRAESVRILAFAWP